MILKAYTKKSLTCLVLYDSCDRFYITAPAPHGGCHVTCDVIPERNTISDTRNTSAISGLVFLWEIALGSSSVLIDA